MMTDIQESMASQLSLLEKVDLKKTSLDMDALFDDFCSRVAVSDDCLNLATSIENVFPNKKNYLESEEFCKLTVGLLNKDFGEKSDADLEDLDRTAQELCKYLPDLEDEAVVADIRNAWDEYYASVDAMAERYAEEHDFGYDYDSGESACEIDNLFSTLKE